MNFHCKYVYEYMAKNGCRIGGEQSGHIIFSKSASTGDGIQTSLKMMEVMLAKKMSVYSGDIEPSAQGFRATCICQPKNR